MPSISFSLFWVAAGSNLSLKDVIGFNPLGFTATRLLFLKNGKCISVKSFGVA